jgi:hypothetical protein
MLTDRYELPLSTTSSAARDAYVQGFEAKLTMYPGAIEAFDRAIAADPGFALAHAARAHLLLERGDAAAVRASMAVASSLAAGLSAREAGHIAFFDLLSAGDAEAALAALPTHLNAWPRGGNRSPETLLALDREGAWPVPGYTWRPHGEFNRRHPLGLRRGGAGSPH